jgi:hypothetical protein
MRVYLAAISLLLCTACASVPQTELKAYRDAFAQSKLAIGEIILDYGQARDEQAQKLAARQHIGPAVMINASFPRAFAPPAPEVLDHATVMGKTIEAIERYNDLLVSLAEGKSVTQLQGSAQQFVVVLGSLTNLTAGVGPLIVDVLGELEKARSHEEFKKAVLAGRPVIDKMLDLLIANAADYYALRASLAGSETDAMKGQMAVRLGAMEKRVALNPSAPDTWAATSRIVNATLTDVGGLSARKNGVQLEGKCLIGKAAPCASLNPTDLTDSVLSLQQDALRYQRAVEKMNTYFSLIQNYVRLLQLNKQALADLSSAIDRPQALVPQFQGLYATAMLIRKDLLKIRSV